MMDRVVGFQKESAAANGWESVDFSAPMVEIGRRVQAGQPSFSLSMATASIRTTTGMVMAYLYLKAQGFAGREVADVQIDAAKAKVLKAGNCEITGLRRNGREIVSTTWPKPCLPARHPDARDGIQAQPGRGHEAGSFIER